MDLSIGALLGLLLLMLVLSGCFSGTETAMISLDRYQLNHLADSGHRGAKIAQRFLKSPDKLLSLILLGNNFVNIIASTLMTLLALRVGSDVAIAIGTGMLTITILIFSELAPKTYATKYPQKIAFVAVYPLLVLEKILLPGTWIINQSANAFLRLMGVDSTNQNTTSNREQLLTLISSKESDIDEHLSNMIASLIELEDHKVNQIQVPRHEIVGIDINDSEESILSLLRSSPYNRLPVYEQSLDHMIGILHVRDLLSSLHHFSKSDLWKYTHDPYYIPENVHLKAQLEQFRIEKQAMAITVDEYGEITGLLCIQDILEEFVGRFTSNISDQMPDILKSNDGTYTVSGSCSLKELSNEYGIELQSDSSSSINGYLLELLGILPEGPCCLKSDRYQFDITKLNNGRITEVVLTPIEMDDSEESLKTIVDQE